MIGVGKQVICIDAENQLYGGLVEGKLYRVKYLKIEDDIISGIYIEGFQYPHKIERFRELEDEDFTENLLNKITQEVKDELGNI